MTRTELSYCTSCILRLHETASELSWLAAGVIIKRKPHSAMLLFLRGSGLRDIGVRETHKVGAGTVMKERF